MSKKIRIFLVGCMLMVMCCIGFTAGASEDAKAKVVAHNLTITDAGINVNFYVDIQGDVTVTLNDTEVEVPATTEKIIIDAKAYNCYKFTQPVVAKEMDQKVSLVIKSGDEPIVEDSYCVNDYATSVIGDKYNYNYEELVKAMTYYGDFAEVYLNYDAEQADEAEAFLQQFDETAKNKLTGDAYKIVKGEKLDGIEATGIQLNLVSEVSIRLNFNVTDDKALNYEFTAVSGNITKELGTLKKGSYNGAEYYYVDIENIGADALDKAYDIKVGDTTVLSNCSALSYARAVIGTYENNSGKADLVNLAKALYLYNQKAKTYVLSQTAAVYDIFYTSEGFSATPDGATPVYLTGNDDVTTDETDQKVTTLSQLNGKRIKGCTVWMETAYPVSRTEEITGPYVIRRYAENAGSVLNVTGTATFTATVDVNTGDFAAKHPGGIDEFTISNKVNNEVAVSGTLNVTGNAKTGVITVADGNTASINTEGLTADGAVVFASHEGVNLSGNGELSAISLLEDGMGHFDVVKHENNVRMASVICVCGDDVTGETSHEDCPWAGENGIAAVYDIPWQSYTVTTTTGTLPGLNASAENPKFYYLTQGFTLGQSQITGVSHLDLNGQTITGSTKWNVQLFSEQAIYSISDSKGDGKIQLPQDFSYTNIWGGFINYNQPGTFKMYGGTLDMTKVSEVSVNMIDVNNGQFFMYGGVIKPAQSKTANSNCIATRNGGMISVTGGTIYGDVLISSSSGRLEIGNNAQVGKPFEGNYSYGVFAWGSATPLICNNLNENAQIFVQKDSGNIALSEGENSTSLASVFTLVNEGKDGHYGVVKKSDGTLAFATTICACGKNVSDDHNHTCAWVETNGIANVYNIDWKAHTTDNGLMPGYNEEGCYYLTSDIDLEQTTFLTSTDTHLDLNGKTIICDVAERSIRTDSGSANYSIADSKGTGTMLVPANYSSDSYGSLIQLWNTGSSFTMYGGTIDMSHSTSDWLIDLTGTNGNTFYMYGGVIKTNSTNPCFYVRRKTILNVQGGTIQGKVLLGDTATIEVGNDAKVGIPLNDEAINYGIEAEVSGPKLVCNNLNENAEVIITKTENLAFQEKTNSNSVLSVIKAAEGHATIARQSDGLVCKSVICVCGTNVTGLTEHTCPYANNIEDVYDIKWQAYTVASGYMPGYSKAGCYYLRQNLQLTGQTNITQTSHLDLNGKTITGHTGRSLHINLADIEYSIADSKEGGKMQFPENYSYTAGNGGMIWADYPGTFRLYGGTIDMSRATTGGDMNLIDVASSTGARFYMYGGEIIGAQDGDCIGVRQKGTITVTGGIIRGEITLAGPDNTITVGNNAQVGLPVNDNARYGITAWDEDTPTPIYCENVTGIENIYLNTAQRFVLSGSGEASAFKVLTNNYEVVNTESGLRIQEKN